MRTLQLLADRRAHIRGRGRWYREWHLAERRVVESWSVPLIILRESLLINAVQYGTSDDADAFLVISIVWLIYLTSYLGRIGDATYTFTLTRASESKLSKLTNTLRETRWPPLTSSVSLITSHSITLHVRQPVGTGLLCTSIVARHEIDARSTRSVPHPIDTSVRMGVIEIIA